MEKIKTIATVTIALALVGILVMFVRLHHKTESILERIKKVESLLPSAEKLKDSIKNKIEDLSRNR